jgi:glycerophosphoryl diester phosphodiesterase
VVVVSHDPLLNPDITRDESGTWLPAPGPAIWALSHTALRQYSVGRIRPGSRLASLFPEQVAIDDAGIPTLSEVLLALPDARFTVEVKIDPAHPHRTATPVDLTDGTLAVIDAADAASRVTIESFDWRVQQHVRATRPEIRLAWLTRAETVLNAALWWGGVGMTGSIAQTVAGQGGPVWAPDHTGLTRPQIEEAHAFGLSVLAWTVNDPADMRRLIGWGVDGLISDRPDLALRYIR